MAFQYYGGQQQLPSLVPQQRPQQQEQSQTDQLSGLLGNVKKSGMFDSLMGGGSDSGLTGLGSDPSSMGGVGQEISGMSAGGSSSGAGSGGLGAAGIGGIVLAAIAAQHGLSQDTDTTFEGVKSGDAFSGQFGTEPWLAWAHDKLGLSPTAGERFDAAVKNDDWGEAFKRSFEMSDYWADPGSTWAESAASGLGMDENAAGWVFNPIGELLGGL